MNVPRMNGEEVEMRLSWRDEFATLFVGVGALAYGLWIADVLSVGPRVVAVVVLVLGVAASLTAVVYGAGAGLLHASKLYLIPASLIGLVAAIAGVWALAAESEVMLGVLVAADVALWLMATIRHMLITPMPNHRPATA